MRRRTLPAVLAVAVLLLGACAGTDDATDADETTTTATVATDETTDDAADDEPAEVTWEAVSPGGDCQCADGSEYRYWVSEGDPTRVAFFLQGGGACFTAETCAFEGGGTTYKVTVTDADDPSDGSGLLDLTDGRNPLEGWSMVYVPYCTGDVHLGDATTEYSDELTVQHKGAVNATAALDDLADRFPDCSVIIVTTFARAGYLRRAMASGAKGFLVKDDPVEQLAAAIRRVLSGETVVQPDLALAALRAPTNPLTEREQEVLLESRDGATVADIAGRLYLSEQTVRNYLSSAIGKAGARNRAEALALAEDHGWV